MLPGAAIWPHSYDRSTTFSTAANADPNSLAWRRLSVFVLERDRMVDAPHGEAGVHQRRFYVRFPGPNRTSEATGTDVARLDVARHG